MTADQIVQRGGRAVIAADIVAIDNRRPSASIEKDRDATTAPFTSPSNLTLHSPSLPFPERKIMKMRSTDRNPFFHAPAPDAPATFAGTIVDLVAGVSIMLAIIGAGFWLMVLA